MRLVLFVFTVILSEFGCNGQISNLTRAAALRVPGEIALRFNGINDYGCHCYLGGLQLSTGQTDDRWRKEARGKPLDGIDSVCKRLHQAYQCIEDETPNEICNADTTWYVLPELTRRMDKERYLRECETLNEDSLCQQKLCKVEVAFIVFFWQQVVPENKKTIKDHGDYDENRWYLNKKRPDNLCQKEKDNKKPPPNGEAIQFQCEGKLEDLKRKRVRIN